MKAQSSENHDTSSIDSSHNPAPVRGKMTREERFRQLEEAVASGSDVEWEYEALGVTYEELMEYFDNLKESTA